MATNGCDRWSPAWEPVKLLYKLHPGTPPYMYRMKSGIDVITQPEQLEVMYLEDRLSVRVWGSCQAGARESATADLDQAQPDWLTEIVADAAYRFDA